MIDLHSHLLPRVDDGSRSLEQSIGVLTRFQAEGITGVCLTPHLLASQAPAGVPAPHQRAWEELVAAAPAGVALYRGAEVMLDRPLEAAVAEQRAVTLNGSRFLLVEFPRLVAGQTVEHALALVVSIGLVPLLAHPERYSCCSPDAAHRWKTLGALLQLDGPTLLSSRPRGERARQLLQYGLADVAAGDNHGDTRGLRGIWDALIEHEGGIQAALLMRTNPAAIVADQPVEPVAPFTFRLAFLERIRAMFGRATKDRE